MTLLHAVLADILDEARRDLDRTAANGTDGLNAERRLLRSTAQIAAYAALAADLRFALVRTHR